MGWKEGLVEQGQEGQPPGQVGSRKRREVMTEEQELPPNPAVNYPHKAELKQMTQEELTLMRQ